MKILSNWPLGCANVSHAQGRGQSHIFKVDLNVMLEMSLLHSNHTSSEYVFAISVRFVF